MTMTDATLGLIAAVLIAAAAAKAIPQAAHDAAACPTLYTEGCIE